MNWHEKEEKMLRFLKKEFDVLISTTVIEVGIDIPDANIILINDAHRFGLSQLHQLRGRVGRGADQSYCILMTADKLSREAARRIEVMVSTSDGFEIAETDLQLRGPGDIEGTQQSGIPFDLRIANLAKDGQIIEYVRHIAEEILVKDPLLEIDKNLILRNELKRLFSQQQSWSNIS
jgi:ATP-dependent DNA helicase RecG